MNHKLIDWLFTEEGLSVGTKKRTKRAGHLRVVLPPAEAPKERWSMDFVADELASGQRFRILTVVDPFSRVSPLIEPTSRSREQRWVRIVKRFHDRKGKDDSARPL